MGGMWDVQVWGQDGEGVPKAIAVSSRPAPRQLFGLPVCILPRWPDHAHRCTIVARISGYPSIDVFSEAELMVHVGVQPLVWHE
eukprot:1599223-Amphidinium_carterae.1